MHTKADRLNNKCTHRQYYAQFVDNLLKETVRQFIGEDAIMASTDEHLNDIPLERWDQLFITIPKLKAAGDTMTQAGMVYILKEAARQIKEDNDG